MKKSMLSKDWKTLTQFLPKDWKKKAREFGVIKRQRNSNPEELLRVLLIHLADGCSLKEAVVRANVGQISTMSSVALFKKLSASSEWLRWMAKELLANRSSQEVKKPDWLERYRIRSVDASVICEPGSTGTDWRLHYSLELFSLHCDHFVITRPKIAESFLNFPVQPDDLLIGDRAYSSLKELWYVKNNSGHFLVRLRKNSLRLHWRNQGRFHLLKNFRKLEIGEVRQWVVHAQNATLSPMKLRLVCLRKSEEAAQEAIRKVRKQMSKKQRKINEETLELHKYVILVTSLMDKHISKEMIAELYRLRWQIEIAFKRLKSIMGLSHLPKKNKESARAWLHGKILVAMLVQSIIEEGHFFSPWGYPL